MEKEWLTLDEDEEVLWEGNPRIQSIIPSLIVGIPFSVVLIGIPIVVGAYLSVKNTEFVVTSQGLYRKSGVLSRSVQKIGFDKVQNISFSQGVFGNYFGYGSIEISTAGGSGVEMRFRNIDEPRRVQQIINRGAEQRRESGQEGESAGSDVQRQMLEELRKIRKLLEN
jgi:uncharacterized membrane protein YdbT with pleckstrin-like domain